MSAFCSCWSLPVTAGRVALPWVPRVTLCQADGYDTTGWLRAPPIMKFGRWQLLEHSPERPLLDPDQMIALAEAVPARWRARVPFAGWCGRRFSELARRPGP